MSLFKLYFLSLSLLSILSLSACGTLRGAGQDLEAAGRGLQDIVD